MSEPTTEPHPTAERPLGRSGVRVPALGVGTNHWTTDGSKRIPLRETLAAAVDAGVGFFDTAEVYGFGRSEAAIGQAASAVGRPVLLASKFAPLPYRVAPAQFASALDKTLKRLGRESLDLYYLHFPFSPLGIGTWMREMARAVKAGKIRAVGVSNCSAEQMHKAADALARYDVPLAANEVQYSLLHRNPETNGVLDACRQMDVALVAYRPLSGGALGSEPSRRSARPGLAETLREVAAAHNATAVQVGLAWLLKRDDHVIPIPGATRPEHARENAGALSLKLSQEELAAVDQASAPA